MTDVVYGDIADMLWRETQVDWHVTVHHTLTEPVCCTIDIYSDYDDEPKLEGFLGDYDINKSIVKACEKMLEIWYRAKK